jgi:hypothetical protein
MAGKIQLKLKKKEAAPAAAPTAAAASAPAFAMPASSGGGVLTIELIGTAVHVAEVVIKKK